MSASLYQNVVLTVIAIALSVIALRDGPAPARALGECGTISDPCAVLVLDVKGPVEVFGRVSVR